MRASRARSPKIVGGEELGDVDADKARRSLSSLSSA